jgi:mono/diheme cytochrome c family protein
MRRTLPEKQRSGDRLVLLENLDHCLETGAGDLPATQPRWRKLSAMLLIAAVILSLGACAGPHWRDRGPVTPWTGPMGGRMDGPGMMGYGPGSGYGPGMHGYGRSTGGDGSSAGMSMLRHRQAMMGGIPSGYAGLRNPLPVNRSVIDSGETLYEANCAACHGSKGAGDGPAAAGMSPPPANLRWTVQRPIASDGYLMWAISDGGAQLRTGMPAFAGALSEQDRWRIIRYLRSLGTGAGRGVSARDPMDRSVS